MIAKILTQADDDLLDAFESCEFQRQGLGLEFVEEFRYGVERILEHPQAW